MLSTGMRTPIGIKIMGADLQKVQELGEHIEMVLKEVPGTKSVFAERTAGGYFIDFTLKRSELARYGLTVDQVNNVMMSAIGGKTSPRRSKGGRDIRSTSDISGNSVMTWRSSRECLLPFRPEEGRPQAE